MKQSSNVAMASCNSYLWVHPNPMNPMTCNEKRYLIVSDAILDNRESLMQLLGLSNDLSTNEILIEMYKKYGSKSLDYIVGDFAFVIHDSLNKVTFFARDQLGKRLLYYCRIGNQIYFGSTLNAFKAVDASIEMNEKWLVGFIGIPNILHEII